MRWLAIFILLFASLLGADSSSGSPITCDLGEGLSYHRVQRLPADLPTSNDTNQRPLVLDVRYTKTTPEAAAALDAWIKFRTSPRAPLLILANSQTAPALLATFRASGSSAAFVVVGSPGQGFAPDISVPFGSAEERQAYDALANGAAPELLLNDVPTKVRNDEASLARDHAPDANNGAPGSAPNRPASTGSQVVPVDRVLQRAVQLHRALLALKKL